MNVTRETAERSIQDAERKLRQLLTLALATQHGRGWESELSSRITEELLSLEAREQRLRPGSKVDEGKLAYAGLPHLKAIIQQHWACCCNGLGLWRDQAAMCHDLDRLMTIRGPGAHGREVQHFELLEAEGIARRLIAGAQRVGGPVPDRGRIWSRIIRAEDSLGNRSNTGLLKHLQGRRPIRVGDRIELRVQAEDTMGRPLQYRLVDFDTPLNIPWQGSSEFLWSPSRPRASTEISIEVRTISGPWGSDDHDDFIDFRYEVHP